jgi:hypothetical protein
MYPPRPSSYEMQLKPRHLGPALAKLSGGVGHEHLESEEVLNSFTRRIHPGQSYPSLLAVNSGLLKLGNKRRNGERYVGPDYRPRRFVLPIPVSLVAANAELQSSFGREWVTNGPQNASLFVAGNLKVLQALVVPAFDVADEGQRVIGSHGILKPRSNPPKTDKGDP